MPSLLALRVAPRAAAATRRARVGVAAGFAAALLGLCAWRLACVQAGPDPDTDAYGHFLIARQLLATPLELRVHWVWLPLYHLLLAPGIALGATLDHVRQANALGAALPPLLLLWALARAPGAPGAGAAASAPGAEQREPARPLARLGPVQLGAALLTAASPLLMRLGTTGQMEVFFCALLMLSVALLVHGRLGAAALVLCALVLTRYEGWVVAATVGAVLLWRRAFGGAPLGRGAWACVLAPGLSVLAWAALRRAGGEPWFGFILDNQAFAEHALENTPGRAGAQAAALARYAAIAPWQSFGPCAACALLGIGPTLRRDGVWLVAPGAALLAFLTLSSLTRSQLGLERHFMSVVPFAATWIAHGLGRLRAVLAPALERRLGGALGRRAAWLALVPLVLSAAERSSSRLGAWLDTTRAALPEARAVAQFLRRTPPDARVVCEDATVQVLSGLAPRRFVRARADDAPGGRLAELPAGSDVYVVQRAKDLRALAAAGPPSYGTLDGPPDAFVVLRFATGSATPLGG